MTDGPVRSASKSKNSQDRRLADQLRSGGRVVHTGELDDDLVVALLPDLGLGHAELVDPVPHDVDRPGQVFGRERVTFRRIRLEDDFEAALEVEAEGRLLMSRRAGNNEQRHAGEGREDDRDQREMSAPV